MFESLPFADQPWPLLSWVLAALAVVVIGIAKSGFGSGVGIAAVPIFVFAFGDPTAAMGALLPLLIAADVVSVYHHWGTWDKQNLKVLAPGSLLGIGLGLVALYLLMGMPSLWWMQSAGEAASTMPAGKTEEQLAAEYYMKLAIGLICLAYIALDQIKIRLAPQMELKPTYLSGSIAGIAAGIVTSIAHAAGPVTTIYLLGQQMEKQRFIGTAVIYFFTVNMIKVPFYVMLGLIYTDTIVTGLWLLPLVPIGTTLGLWLNKKMSDQVFRYTILIIVFISGLQLISGYGVADILAMMDGR